MSIGKAIVAAVLIGGGILVSVAHSDRRDRETELLRRAAVQPVVFLSRLLGQTYTDQEIEDWALVCTRDAFRDANGAQPAKMGEELYRQHLWDLGDAITRVEQAQSLDLLLGPQSELATRLAEFGRWVADAKVQTDFYECGSERTPRRLRWLEQAEAVYRLCLTELWQQGIDGTTARRHPDMAACHRQLVTLWAMSATAEPASTRLPSARRDSSVRLGRLTAGDELVEVTVSPRTGRRAQFIVAPDGRRVAFLVKRAGQYLAVVDGEEGVPYESIEGPPAFSADSTRVAYEARTDRGSMLVIDGVEGPPYRNIIWFGFSPIRSRVAYLVYRDGGRHFIVDGVEQPIAGSSAHIALVFSPDAARVAYVSGEGPLSVVVDGRQGAPYDAILAPGPIFSPDSAHVAYAAQRNGETFVVVDEKEWPAFDGVGRAGVLFSPDSSHVAYIARQGEQHVVVLDGTPGLPFDDVGYLTFSPDSTRFAYWGTRNWEHFLVIDGKLSEAYAKVTEPGPIFSPDSRHVGYSATQQGRARVVIDGRDGPLYDSIASGSPVFSPDSSRVAYVAATDRKARAVIDGRESATYDRITGNAAFSPDSKRTAFVAQRDKEWHVVVDGDEGAGHDGIASPLRFSPDSAHLAFVVERRPGATRFVVLDGRAQQPFYALDQDSLTFGPDSAHLAYLAWAAGWRLVVDDSATGDAVGEFLPSIAPVFDSPSQVGALGRARPDGDVVRLVSTSR